MYVGQQVGSWISDAWNSRNLSQAQRLAAQQNYYINNGLDIASMGLNNAYALNSLIGINPNSTMAPMQLAAIRGISPTSSLFGKGDIARLTTQGASWRMDYNQMGRYANSVGYLSSIQNSISKNTTGLDYLAYSHGMDIGQLALSTSSLIPYTQGNVGLAMKTAANLSGVSPGYGGLVESFAGSPYISKFTKLILSKSLGIPYEQFMNPNDPNHGSAVKKINSMISSVGQYGEKNIGMGAILDILGISPATTDYTNRRSLMGGAMRPNKSMPDIMSQYIAMNDSINNKNLSGASIDTSDIQGQFNSLADTLKDTITSFNSVNNMLKNLGVLNAGDKSKTRTTGATSSTKH